MRSCVIRVSGAVGVGLLTASSSAQDLRAVVLSGDPAPGSATTFVGFTNVVVNNSGRTAFTGILPLGATGVWSDASGVLGGLALAGGTPPGMPGSSFQSLSGVRPLISDTTEGIGPGRAAFLASTSAGQAIFAVENGVLSLVARDGGVSPGDPPGVFSLTNGTADPVLNSIGRTTFKAAVTSSSPPAGFDGIWIGSPSLLEMATRTVFGTPPPIGFVGFATPVCNDLNQIAMVANFRDVNASRQGLYIGTVGSFTARATATQQATGLPVGATFSTFYSPLGINNSSHLVFAAGLQGTSVTSNDNWCIWKSTINLLELVVREGDQVPGAIPGVVFDDGSTVGRTAVISDSGHVAFTCQLRGPGVDGSNNQAIFVKSPGFGGALRMVARLGMLAPGLPTGTTLASLPPSSFALNAQGQIMFNASVQGTVFGQCVFGTDTAGRLTLIMREGEVRTIRPNLTARLGQPSQVLQTGGSDGRQRNTNDAGEFAFSAGWSQIGGSQSGNGLFIVKTPCAADWNLDSTVNSQDFFDFLAAFFAGTGDFNNNGSTNSQDFFDFLAAFFVGCS